MFESLLKALGIDPKTAKQQYEEGMVMIKNFDNKLNQIIENQEKILNSFAKDVSDGK